MTDQHVHTAHTHTAHADVVKRLKRANGHLSTVIAMIEAQRPCIDIAQQLHAVERAVGNAKKGLPAFQEGLGGRMLAAWRLRMSAY
ncbi:MAG: hypothetical protein B7Y42_16195 [Polaromonas sp. 28-63-22]|nr:MAG: hypothetical protein B7Y42_16195 [Polaromonas sp. 28-63-22]